MNKDKDSKINYSEFVECSKQDPTVMDVRPVFIDPYTLRYSHTATGTLTLRRPCIARPHLRFPDALCLSPSDMYLTSHQCLALALYSARAVLEPSCRLLLSATYICIVIEAGARSCSRIQNIIFHNLPYLFNMRVSTSSPIHLCIPSASSRWSSSAFSSLLKSCGCPTVGAVAAKGLAARFVASTPGSIY